MIPPFDTEGIQAQRAAEITEELRRTYRERFLPPPLPRLLWPIGSRHPVRGPDAWPALTRALARPRPGEALAVGPVPVAAIAGAIAVVAKATSGRPATTARSHPIVAATELVAGRLPPRPPVDGW